MKHYEIAKGSLEYVPSSCQGVKLLLPKHLPGQFKYKPFWLKKNLNLDDIVLFQSYILSPCRPASPRTLCPGFTTIFSLSRPFWPKQIYQARLDQPILADWEKQGSLALWLGRANLAFCKIDLFRFPKNHD